MNSGVRTAYSDTLVHISLISKDNFSNFSRAAISNQQKSRCPLKLTFELSSALLLRSSRKFDMSPRCLDFGCCKKELVKKKGEAISTRGLLNATDRSGRLWPKSILRSDKWVMLLTHLGKKIYHGQSDETITKKSLQLTILKFFESAHIVWKPPKIVCFVNRK